MNIKRFILIPFLIISTIASSLTLEEIKQWDKVELHLHLGGAYPKEYLRSIATDQQMAQLEQELEKIHNGVDYEEAFPIFELIGRLVNTEEKVKDGLIALCRWLEADHVIYAEIRTGLKDMGQGDEHYLQTLLEGIRDGETEWFTPRLLLSLRRFSTVEQAKRTVDLAIKYQAEGVVGIDISGISTLGNIRPLFPELLRAKAAGLGITVHLGESPNENDQLEILETLRPHRIGHAVFLTEEAKEWLKIHPIPTEMCLTSALKVKMIEKPHWHPALSHYALRDMPYSVCTDDPLIFNVTLSDEYALLYSTGVIDADKLYEVCCASQFQAFDQSFRQKPN